MAAKTDQPASRTLTALDRCDKGECNAAAGAVVTISGGELLFCRHHLNAQRPALELAGARIQWAAA